jgi:hypothetical protein
VRTGRDSADALPPSQSGALLLYGTAVDGVKRWVLATHARVLSYLGPKRATQHITITVRIFVFVPRRHTMCGQRECHTHVAALRVLIAYRKPVHASHLCIERCDGFVEILGCVFIGEIDCASKTMSIAQVPMQPTVCAMHFALAPRHCSDIPCSLGLNHGSRMCPAESRAVSSPSSAASFNAHGRDGRSLTSGRPAVSCEEDSMQVMVL